MDNMGGGEVLLVLLIIAMGLLSLGGGIYTIVDAARRPQWQFDATGKSRTLWIVLPIIGILACGLVSIVAFFVYLSSVRPALDSARQPGAYGYPGGDAPPPPPPPFGQR